VLFHFDEAQPLGVEFVEHGLDERGLSRAARTGQERIVGRPAFDELARVLLDQRLLAIDAVEIRKSDTVQFATGWIKPRRDVLRQRNAMLWCQSTGQCRSVDVSSKRSTVLDQTFAPHSA